MRYMKEKGSKVHLKVKWCVNLFKNHVLSNEKNSATIKNLKKLTIYVWHKENLKTDLHNTDINSKTYPKEM